ncbi:MAG TPA: haloacid dehalogenase [Thermoflexia bacterium]|nr:haloacid dehalogenase [Thermoflexia bacterium]
MERIVEEVRTDFVARDEAREQALRRSRELTRLCATAIRATHRGDREDAAELLAQADQVAAEMMKGLVPYPDLLYAGYTQDGLKELAEAHLMVALLDRRPLPSPSDLGIPPSTYLNGLCEAASELRRRCLDLLRHGETAEAERLLETMDTVYDALMTFDFPDGVTGGLRRRVDQLRGVLERTRGDVTQALREERLLAALDRFEAHLGEVGDDRPGDPR